MADKVGDGHWTRCIHAHHVAQRPLLGELPLREHLPLIEAERPLLRIEALDAVYADKPVLHKVSIDIHPRRCVAIVGQSGAGKTTLSRCLVGLHSDWLGTIEFEGEAIPSDRRRRSHAAVRSIQYVFQNPYTSLNPRKTIGQLVEQPLRQLFDFSRDERHRRVVAALEDAALSEKYMSYYPDQLSGGERQRVAIARALVVEPKLLVCDEATSALDVSVQAAIVELLDKLKRDRGLTIVLITHNLAIVRSLADDVVILRDGIVVEQGQQVLDNPQTDYAVQLLADTPKPVAGSVH
ncbi:ABC transporter ATP-binding protein [Rhodococcus sp. 27YEA15]|uniref:ABC transporter ATP-binding protein n=1 Tax=Rhodococcus sp. 27YEA15 TaxID=3156259 RepID=UPI003C7ECD89